MSIASIAGSSAWMNQLSVHNALSNLVGPVPGSNVNASTPASASPSGSSSGSLMHDILTTLQHMVFPASANSAAAAPAATALPTSATPAATASKSAQDLQSFMATLIQALHQAGGAAGSAAVAHGGHGGHGGHGHVSNQLQSLLQEIDGGSDASSPGTAVASSASPGVSSLESSFQNLMQDLSPGIKVKGLILKGRVSQRSDGNTHWRMRISASGQSRRMRWRAVGGAAVTIRGSA